MNKKYIAEFIGTFFLVSAICFSREPLAVGAMLMVMVYAFGHISGAHFNPAVTFAIWLRKKISMREAVIYWIVQLAGSYLAALIYMQMTTRGFELAPLDSNNFHVIIAELVFTFALATVVLNVATHPSTSGNSFYGLAIGFTVLAGAYTVGNISGGAFNPAVVLGPMLVDAIYGGHTIDKAWLYLVGEIVGSALAAYLFVYMSPEA